MSAGKTISAHNAVVAELCSATPALRSKGFRKAVRDVLCQAGKIDDLPDDPSLHGSDTRPFWEELQDELKFIPDAFQIIPASSSAGVALHCHEVVDSSGLNKIRRKVYGNCWFFLDSCGIDLRLFVYDLYGGNYEASPQKYFYGDVWNTPITELGFAA